MTPMSEDGGPLREWSPLTNLLQQIPAKLQTGIFTQDIIFTCIDVLPEFIAIGTNCGIIYWFDRESGDLQKLQCEHVHSSITCLSAISTVDYMVAAGNNQGVVMVFQIPKNLPESLPDSLKPKRKKRIERYNISGLHKSSVSTVEWSKNGMKLFSGDQEGLVIFTEFDFCCHLSRSSELLNEKYSVVQLSYQQGLLLVSTFFRTILVDANQNNKVSQVGQKERKTLGKLGAVFCKRQTPTQEPTIYASRPGLRLWQADKSGTVMKTLIFKEALQSSSIEVMLLNPAPETLKKKRGEPTFGILLPFCDDLLITYSDEVIYVINPVTIAITSIVSDLRKITDVACTKDEIFILEGERNIIRIAYHPESCLVETMEETKDSLSTFAEISKPVTASIFGITSKLKESSIVPTIPFYKINPSHILQAISALPSRGGVDPNPVVNAEEATEIPRIVPLAIDTTLIREITVETEPPLENSNSIRNKEEQRNRRQIFQKIGEQEFEDVVFTPERKNKIINECIEKNDNNNEDLFLKPLQDFHETYSSLLTLSIDDNAILKSERNLESIQKDVEDKERLLADVLNFDLSEYMTSSQIFSPESSINTSLNTITYVNCTEPTIESAVSMTETTETVSQHADNDSDEDESYRTELMKLQTIGECSKSLITKKNNLSDKVTQKMEEKETCQISGVKTRELEIEFNVLSKEFVSTICDDTEDWVVISSSD